SKAWGSGGVRGVRRAPAGSHQEPASSANSHEGASRAAPYHRFSPAGHGISLDETAQDRVRGRELGSSGTREDPRGLLGREVAVRAVRLDTQAQSLVVELGMELGRIPVRAHPEHLPGTV